MLWFKHDTDAHRDAKLRRVVIKYGMEGYGLYFYCIELIAGNVSNANLTFELEHDAEIIAHDIGIHYERVQEMMTYMINLGLFEESHGTITCMKLAKRLDQSMTSNTELRKKITQLREGGHDGVMTVSGQGHDGVMKEQKRKEQKRALPNDFVLSERVIQWATKKGYSNLQQHYEFFCNKAAAKGYKYIDWDRALMNAIQSDWAGLNGKDKSDPLAGME